MKKSIATCLFATLAATNAIAAPIKLTFEGVGHGAYVNDFYNGGTDSSGNVGTQNYHIHFDGALVVHNQYGAYITGGASMTFAPDVVQGGYHPLGYPGFLIGFLARSDTVDGTYVDINNSSPDRIMVSGTANPYCGVWSYVDYAQCTKQGWSVTAPDTLFGYAIYSDGTATQVSFDTSAIDNIEFGALTEPAPRIVPEPASAALLGLGLAVLVRQRRRK